MTPYAILQLQDGSMQKVGEYRLDDGTTVNVTDASDDVADGIREAATAKLITGGDPPDGVDAPVGERREYPDDERRRRHVETYLRSAGYYVAPLNEWENRPHRPDDGDRGEDSSSNE